MNMQWMNRSINILIFMLFVVIALVVATLSMALWKYTPLRIDRIIVTPYNIVQRGEKLCFKFEGEKFYDITSHVTVELVNGEAFHIMSYDAEITKGNDFKQRCFVVPSVLCPNIYQIRWTGTFDMNLFNHPKKQFFSDPIEVK
jgi:hypothetical protein